MNDDQVNEDLPDALNSSNVENRSSSQPPHVNHSVQYSIETNVESTLEGDKIPPIPIETLANDLSEMKKIVKDGFKVTTNRQTTITSTTPTITTRESFTTTFINDIDRDQLPDDHTSIDAFFDEPREVLFEDLINRTGESLHDSRFSLIEKVLDTESNANIVKNEFSDGDLKANSGRNQNQSVTDLFMNATTTVTSQLISPSIITSTPFSLISHSDEETTTITTEFDTTEKTEPALQENFEQIVLSDFVENKNNLSLKQPMKIQISEITLTGEDNASNLDNLSNFEESTDDLLLPEEEEFLFSTSTPMIGLPLETAVDIVDKAEQNELILNNIRLDQRISNVIPRSTIVNTTKDGSLDFSSKEVRDKDADMVTAFDDFVADIESVVTEMVPTFQGEESLPATIVKLESSTVFDEELNTGMHQSSLVGFEKENENVTKDMSTLALSMDSLNLLPFAELVLQNDSKLSTSDSSDFDYTSLAMGQSIEIDGSFPKISGDAAIKPMIREHPGALDYESYSDYSADGTAAGNEPTLDIASILSEIDFSKIDLANLDLSNLDLTGVDLGSLDFSKLPSDLNLDSFDFSKLPSNLDLSTLDLSTFPKNLSIGGINLADVNPSDLAKINVTNLLSDELKTGNLDISNYPSQLNLNEFNFDESRTGNFEPPTLQRQINNKNVPSFRLPNFRFQGNHNAAENLPPFIPPHLAFRHPHVPDFRTNRPHFFLVDNFGNEELVDPNKVNVQGFSNHPLFRQDTRFFPPPQFPVSQINGRPFLSNEQLNTIPILPNAQFPKEQIQFQFDPSGIPNFSQGSFDTRQLSPDINLGNTVRFPIEYNQRHADSSKVPDNNSLLRNDIAKTANVLNLGRLNLSNLNLSELDVPHLLRQFSNNSPKEGRKISVNDGLRQGLVIQDLDYASFFDYPDGDKMNGSFHAPIRAEITPGSRQWVTEVEVDKQIVEELGISNLVKVSRAISFDGNG